VGAGNLLGTHVGRRAHHEPGLGQRRESSRRAVAGRERTRDPEVGHQRVAVDREEDVLRLDVPMHHAVIVSVLKGLCGFPRDAKRLAQR
jgi:hypothetical protein